MKEILADLDRWQQQGEEIALATLVVVRGSAPRSPGARLCLTRSGGMSGSVSGGCVENDVFERATQVLDAGRPAVANYGIVDDLDLEVGLSCGGSIDVLIEPFEPGETWQALRRAVEEEQPAALAIGLSPDSLLGRKLVLLGGEEVVGCIDPGLDREVAAEARRLLPEGGTRAVTLAWRDGEARLFLEAFPPPLRLFIVGATHTAIPLCRIAKELGFRVTVIDPRGVFASRERFPEADEIVRAWPGEALDGVRLDAYAYVVTLSHDPKFDLPTLARVLRSEARYIGAMGSRGTHEGRKSRLREEGFSEGELARIRAPVGLDLGGRSPEEIALAIAAEMLAVRYGRDGRALAERKAAIRDAGR
jgi:xanthine dehydrogenase accessory factor